VEGQMERKLLIEAINTYLHKLPERECNVFIRRYFFAETTAQISKRYDLKESNVLMILSRTRKKLQTYLVQEGLV
jgi:RNA polymerase sigma-70 factor (ECF subfamily)